VTWQAAEVARIGPAACRAVAPSSDGTAFAALADGRLTCWELPDREVWSAVCETGADAADLAWDPTADRILARVRGGLRVFRAVTGEAADVPELAGRADLTVLALAPDGRLAGLGTATGQVLVHDRRSGTVTELRGTDQVTALAWRPDGEELCVARRGSLLFWDVQRREVVTSLTTAGTTVRRLAWSPDGSVVAALDADSVRTFHMSTAVQRPLRFEWRPDGAPVDVAFGREGTHLLVGVAESGLEVTDRDLGRIGRIPADVASPGCLAVSGNGRVVVRLSDREIGVWDLPDTLVPEAGSTAALRRWAIRQALTMGRGATGDAEPGGLPARPVPLLPSRPDTAFPAGPGFAWWPDGRTACVEIGHGVLSRARVPGGKRLWSRKLSEPGIAVTVSAGGSVAASDGRQVTFIGPDGDGDEHAIPGRRPAWAPGPEPALAFVPPGRPARAAMLLEPGAATPRSLPMSDGAGHVCWSPDGSLLAVSGLGHVVLWDTARSVRARAPLRAGSPRRLVGPLAWSPNGRRLAAMVRHGDEAAVYLWDTETWTMHSQGLPAVWQPEGAAVAWSADSALLAFPGEGGVSIWEVASGERLRTLTYGGDPRGLFWSPDGDTLAVTHADGEVVLWELFLDTPVTAGTDEAADRPLPDRPTLVRLGQAAMTAEVGAPLSWSAGLLAFLGADGPPELEALGAHRGLALLTGLRWPPAARMGLAVLLAADLPSSTRYLAPPGAVAGDVAAELDRALAAPAGRILGPPLRAVDVTAALERVTAELLTLLTLLGPEAVSADPALPTRLRRLSTHLPALSPPQLRLLGLRIPLEEAGRAAGVHGRHDREGLARHGSPDALLPTQLALPANVVTALRSRNELLYRARGGGVPSGPHSMIIVLDDTAAAHGAVGTALRLAAHLLAASLVRRGRRCALVGLGHPGWAVTVTRSADLIRLWTATTDGPPDLRAALHRVNTLVPDLTDPLRGAPEVTVFTHPHLPVPGTMRSVRVHYPGRPVTLRRPGTFVLPPQPTAQQLGTVLAGLLDDE
jgi:WD40 repeat protein